MSNIFAAITDWPVIIQAIFGSALFSLLMWAGQRCASSLMSLVSRVSKIRRISYLRTKTLRLQANATKDRAARNVLIIGLIYRASRDLFKGLIWLTLGLSFSSFVGVWGVIGYLGCLYHLFFALDVVKPVPLDDAATAQELKDTMEKLKALTKPDA